MRQDRPHVGPRPKHTKPMTAQKATHAVQKYQSEHAANGVGKSGCKIIDAKKVHGCCLEPKKQWWLLPKGLKVDVNAQVIAQRDHFARDLCEVDLVPIEEMNTTQTRQEQQAAHENPE